MATLTLAHGGFFDPDFGGTTYYVIGSGTSGTGTLTNPWLVDAGDTVRFQQVNADGTGTASGFSIFTNNNNIGISSTAIDKTVASGALNNDAYSWRGTNRYIKRSAAANDTVPDAFSFTDVTGAATSTQFTSNTITLSGMTPGVNVTATVTGSPEQSLDGGSFFTNSSFNVQNGTTIALRKASSASNSDTLNLTLTIGGVSDTWSITTVGADTTPDAFSFTDVSGVTRSATQTSSLITISGVNSPATTSVSGGTYSKNGGSYSSALTTASNGDTFRVRHTSSSSYSTAVNTTLTSGGVSDTFTSTTEAEPSDVTPDAFSFSDTNGVARSATQTSNTVTITGISAATSVSISGGTYSKNGAGYTSGATTAVLNDTFNVRHTSSASFSSAVNTTLTVGGVADTFTSTTLAQDITPDQFTWSDITGVTRSSTVTSNTITLSGINDTVSVSVSGGTYSKNGAGYTSSAGTAVNGDTFAVRHTASSSYDGQVSTTLTIGGVSDIFTSTAESLVTSSTYGLEIYNPSGTVAFRTTDNLGRYFASGTFTIANGSSSAVVSVSGITNSSLFTVLVVENNSNSYGLTARGNITKSTGSFTFQRTGFTTPPSPITAGTTNYYYTVIQTA